MFDIQENLKKLPDSPGVYLHKDKIGRVIYVGKAISLRNRVRQYFQTSYQNSNPKVKALVSHIAEFEYITCGSEMEALILENNLIKKYMPRYNVLLRDDKTYPYIEVTVKEKCPRVLKTRLLRKDGNRYFGPYSDAGAVNETVDLLNDVYAMKRCARETFPANHRPCLNYFIGACRGVCLGNVDQDEYMAAVGEITDFLSGRDKTLLKRLELNMRTAAEQMRYEDAAKWRDKLHALQALKETQRVTMTSDKDMDIVLALRSSGHTFAVLFPVRNGKLSGREHFNIQSEETDSKKEIAQAFLKQYYSQWAAPPPEILLEEEPDEKELLEEYLSQGGRKVKLTVPQRGDKKKLLDLTLRDLAEMTKTLETKAETKREQEETIYREMLSLMAEDGFRRDPAREGTPVIVESYDISNTNGVDSVGAMVVFRGMEPVRRDYRRFRIKTITGPDDYHSLQEVLERRLKRALDGDKGFLRLPDIIMMDGGLGQVSSAMQVLERLGLTGRILVVGLAKDDSHRTRAVVFRDGHEISLVNRPMLFRYAGRIQEEVHRFAIDYHHRLHTKNMIHSVLDDIPGVGPKRRNELLYHFKTIEAVRSATAEQLQEVGSITPRVAENIVAFFKEH